MMWRLQTVRCSGDLASSWSWALRATLSSRCACWRSRELSLGRVRWRRVLSDAGYLALPAGRLARGTLAFTLASFAFHAGAVVVPPSVRRSRGHVGRLVGVRCPACLLWRPMH